MKAAPGFAGLHPDCTWPSLPISGRTLRTSLDDQRRAVASAFDLLELNGDDLRKEPLEKRKAKLAKLLAKADHGVRYNEHLEGDGSLIFTHACKLGFEGIVSKRRDFGYRSG